MRITTPDQEHLNIIRLSRTIFAHQCDNRSFFVVDSGFVVD
jgi:hypothetical protein